MDKKPTYEELEKRIQELEKTGKEQIKYLKETQQHLSRAQKISKTGNWYYDWDTDTEIWSDECFNLYGIDKKDYPNNVVPESVSEQVYEKPDEIQNLSMELAEKHNTYELEFNTVPINGKIKTIHSYCEVERDNNGDLIKVFGTDQDITELKQAEEEKEKLHLKLSQLQKTESLGRMAGAIAHHFNNQLSVVMGNLELVLDDLPDDADNREILVQSFEAGRKATKVSQQMLHYLGHISVSKTTINLSDVCRQSLAFLQSASPSGVTINADFPDSGPFVHADAGQIQQVLTNLLTNARESLSDNQGIIGLIIQTVSHEDIYTANLFPLSWQAITRNFPRVF